MYSKKAIISLTAIVFLLLFGSFLYVQKRPNSAPSRIIKKVTNSNDSSKDPIFVGNKNAPTKLVYAVHWFEDFQTQGIYKDGVLTSKGLKQYLEEYTKLHPEIAFEIQIIEYGDYEQTLRTYHKTNRVPDIYQIYSNWGVSYVNEQMLDSPPSDIIEDVQENYFSTAGVTINKQIWGIPTEINTYSLLYNKKLFEEANAYPPRTWSQLLTAANNTTKYNEEGSITQYGIAFLAGNDWQVVDPFLSLLYTNNGQYLNEDNTESRLNQSQAITALEAQKQLFDNNYTTPNANFFDFSEGKVAMVISPPWTKAIFAEAFGDDFEDTVGVLPMPYLQKPATLQYSWFMGVMEKSQNKAEAWDFLKWFAADVQPETNTTRYGDLLANTIGAIPSRNVDLENQDALNDFFTSVYVNQLDVSVPEPNVAQSAEIKKILMAEIESTWSNKQTPEQALNKAHNQINSLLSTQEN